MKSITLIIALFFSTFIFSQELSQELYSIVKSDNATELNKEINSKNINTCYKFSTTSYSLLSLAIKANSTSCFNLLLEKGINTEINCKGKTPLMYAAKYGHLEFAKKLIEKGALANAKNERGRTALDYAKKYKNQLLIDYLSSL